MRKFAVLAVPVVAALLVGSCSSSTTSTTKGTGTTPGSSSSGATATTGTGRTAGSTPGTAPAATINFNKAELQSTIEDLAKELMTPGVVVIVKTPQGELRLAHGTKEWGGGGPISFDDHFRIGSVTKTFTGTVTLQLAEEGRLQLDDPVSMYVPWVPNGENITIEMLLNMRSGLYNYSETLELSESLDETPERVWTTDELLKMAFANKPYFPPDEGYHYSNTNTVLLGVIAEKLDGKPLATIFQDRLFTPLKMENTSYPAATSTAIPTPHPRGYQFGTNVETITSAELPPDQQAAAEAGTLKPNDVTNMNPSWTNAAGQGISTADDLVIWAKAMSDGSLLDDEYQQLRLDSPLPTSPDAPPAAPQYGLGIARFGGTLYGHTGELPGFNNIAVHDPTADVTIVVWVNLGSSPDGQAVATTIGRAIIGELYQPAGATPGTTPGGTYPE